MLVCFNAEKLLQTSALILRNSFDVSDEEDALYLAWEDLMEPGPFLRHQSHRMS